MMIYDDCTSTLDDADWQDYGRFLDSVGWIPERVEPEYQMAGGLFDDERE